MLFNSIDFMLFFPVVVLGYYLLPHKVRYIWVLVSSYYFYMCWNAAYGLILFGTTGVTYLGARILDKGYHFKDRGLTDKQRKIVVALGGSLAEFSCSGHNCISSFLRACFTGCPRLPETSPSSSAYARLLQGTCGRGYGP